MRANLIPGDNDIVKVLLIQSRRVLWLIHDQRCQYTTVAIDLLRFCITLFLHLSVTLVPHYFLSYIFLFKQFAKEQQQRQKCLRVI